MLHPRSLPRRRLPDGGEHAPVQHASAGQSRLESLPILLVNIHPAATLRPNLQVIQAAGGVGSRTTVVVFGLKTIINF